MCGTLPTLRKLGICGYPPARPLKNLLTGLASCERPNQPYYFVYLVERPKDRQTIVPSSQRSAQRFPEVAASQPASQPYTYARSTYSGNSFVYVRTNSDRAAFGRTRHPSYYKRAEIEGKAHGLTGGNRYSLPRSFATERTARQNCKSTTHVTPPALCVRATDSIDPVRTRKYVD